MRIPRPSPALAISLLALFLSLGGVSYGVATGYIDSREIKNKSIREKDLRRNSLTTRSIREAKLGKVPAAAKADVAQSADVAGVAGVAGSASNVQVVGPLRVAPSAFNADPAAASEIPIASTGPLTVYGKCSAENDLAVNPAVNGAVYVRTAQPGAILVSDNADLEGNGGAPDMLNADTPEDDRGVSQSSSYAVAGVANASDHDAITFTAAAPNGSSLVGMLTVATKTGELAGSNGIYGTGPACVFTGFVTLGG
jgi:hypothetical protein